MIIRKKYTCESAHIVRSCSSVRCSHSIHGHSAEIDIYLEGETLDGGGMLYDFGLMKGTVKELVDSMDHCYLLCSKDSKEFKDFIKKNCSRWIEMPFNPSAECLSMFVFAFVSDIIDMTKKQNGEDPGLRVRSVRYRETTSGWAECNKADIDRLWRPEWSKEIVFSPGVQGDWSDDMKMVMNGYPVSNPQPYHQIDFGDMYKGNKED